MKKTLLFLVPLFMSVPFWSQVGINSSGQPPHNSAGLDVDFIDRGLLPPRLTTAQRDAVASPSPGLQIFNTDNKCMEYFRGEGFGWYSMCPLPPLVSTVAPYSVTAQSAWSGGDVINDGGAAVTARGVCWSTSPGPDISDNTTSDGPGIGSYTSSLTGLAHSTTYYVRAYATNSVGTSYGNEVNFTTNTFPSLTTSPITLLFGHNATAGGTVTSDGGEAVTARGICWSESPLPSLADNFTVNGDGTGVFSSQISGLEISSSYYVRAYATNSVGTNYGNEVLFTTTAGTVVQFTTVGSSSWSVPQGVSSGDVLVVGGGGGGGGRSGGGGGGGGVVYNLNYTMSGSIPVTVGGGGTFSQTSPTNQSVGNNGSASVFGNITALGGGGGGSYTAQAPSGGGSGGGGSGGSSYQSGAAAAQTNSGGGTGYGNAGGNGHPTEGPYHSGGGGGAGGMGSNGASNGGGNGGPGFFSDITGTGVYYAGGGGGGSEPGGILALGGVGGGGAGSNTSAGNGGNAAPNTGGGGGGTRSFEITATGGIGGSGIVIVRY